MKTATRLPRCCLLWSCLVWMHCQGGFATDTSASTAASWRSLLGRFSPPQRFQNLGFSSAKHYASNHARRTRKVTDFLYKPSSSAAAATTTTLNEGSSSSSDNVRDYLPRSNKQYPKWRQVWDQLPPSFHEPRNWGRWAASGLQIGLIVYLVHAVFKAASEVLDEYYSSTEQSGMDPAVFGREHVSYAIEQMQRVQNDPTSSPSSLVRRNDDRSMAALAIAQRLVLVCLPLTTGGGDRLSVESILASLSRNEANLLQECLWLPTSPRNNKNESPVQLWDRITGLERVKRGLWSALATVQRQTPHAYASLFDNSSAGVLLYGPPGCGKTMAAMALSAMARIPCLLITPSVLLRKYVGESNQQCRNLFSLAQKLSPCIICIDELDGLFRKRSENEHEVSRDLKTEFLQHWDGMLSRSVRNLVVGATNRPFDVDEAVLRRFTQSHLVGLPDLHARTRFLDRLLQEIPTAPNVDASQLALQTEGYSPSDLRRLLQTAAALGPLRESLAQPRPLTLDDIQHAIHTVPATPLSPSYRHALAHFIRANQSATGGVPDHEHPDQHPTQEGGTYRWETEWGNFYHLGSLQVDAPTFEILSSIMERLSDMADEYSEFEDDDENRYYDEDKDN